MIVSTPWLNVQDTLKEIEPWFISFFGRSVADFHPQAVISPFTFEVMTKFTTCANEEEVMLLILKFGVGR